MSIDTLRLNAESARAAYRRGDITRAEAQKEIMPYAEAFNAKSKELAIKYKQKPKLFNITGYLR